VENPVRQDIFGISHIGTIQDQNTQLAVFVCTDDIVVPHFHIRNKADWIDLSIGICITDPVYFHHLGRERILNARQKQLLIDFLQSDSETFGFDPQLVRTNWDVIKVEWNRNNTSMNVPYDVEMPDYTLL
jgi:hypothetical protein